MKEARVEFTRGGLERAKPPQDGTRRYIRDPSLRGGLLQITSNNVKSFQLQKRFDGVPKRITLGRFDPALPNALKLPERVNAATAIEYAAELPRLNIAMYRALAKQVEVALAAGGAATPAAAKRARLGELALGELLQTYRDEHLEGRSPKTLEWYATGRAKLDAFLDRRISNIGDEEVKRWHAGVKNTRTGKRAPHAANRAAELAHATIEWAKGHGHLGKKIENPFADVEAHEELERKDFLKPDQAPLFLAALAEQPEHWRDGFHLGVLTGQRRGAVLAMRWEELDFTNATWTIKPAHGNKKADVVVPLVQPALAILERRRKHRTGSAFVFPGRAESGHLVAPKGAWKTLHHRMRAFAIAQALAEHKVRFAKDATLAELEALARSHKIHVPVIALRIHDLRHTLGSWMASTNAGLPVIGKALGHKSHQSTQRYAHLQSDPARVAMTAAVEALAAAGSTKVVKLKPRKVA